MKINLTEIPVYYINMEKHIDRRNKIEKMISECKFENYTRIEGLQHRNPKAGCAASHYTILSQFKPPFIILEDDCAVKWFSDEIEIPDDTDLFYLGISSWGRMNSHSGPCVKYDRIDDNTLRIYNMLSTHAMLFITEEMVSVGKRIAEYFYKTKEHLDIGFAEIQKLYNVYSFDDPMFYQTSSNGTDQKLSSYPSIDFVYPHKRFWLPLGVDDQL